MRHSNLIVMLTIVAALVSLLVVSLRLERNNAPRGKSVVTMAIPSNGAAFWPNYVAAEKGFYDHEGLDVRLSQIDPNITVSSLIGGAVDVAYADSTQLLFAIEKRADLQAIGLSTDRHPYRLMAAPSIKTIKALKGKKVGATSEIDVYTHVIETMLRGAGLDPGKDVEWVIGGNQTRRMAAMTSRAIDAGFFSPPSDARLRRSGFNELAFAPDTFPHLMLSAQTVRGDWSTTHGDVLKRLLRAQAKALEWMYAPENKPETIRILIDAIGATPADAAEAYDAFVATRAWRDGCAHVEGLATVIRIMRGAGQLAVVTEPDAAKIARDDWCTAAVVTDER